jgi:hypothetical protein
VARGLLMACCSSSSRLPVGHVRFWNGGDRSQALGSRYRSMTKPNGTACPTYEGSLICWTDHGKGYGARSTRCRARAKGCDARSAASHACCIRWRARGKGEDDRGTPGGVRGKAEDYGGLSEGACGKAEDDRGLLGGVRGKAEDKRGLSGGVRGKAEDERGLSGGVRGKAEDYGGLSEGACGKAEDERGLRGGVRGKAEDDRGLRGGACGKAEDDRGIPGGVHGSRRVARGKPYDARGTLGHACETSGKALHPPCHARGISRTRRLPAPFDEGEHSDRLILVGELQLGRTILVVFTKRVASGSIRPSAPGEPRNASGG